MATKNATVRLPEDVYDYITRNGDSINQGIINEIGYLRRIRQVSLGELKGVFTKNEWVFMADAFNGTLVDDVFCANKGAFIAGCEDAERYEGKAKLHGVDIDLFIGKVKCLSGANIEAIYSRIKGYWEHCGEVDLNEWASEYCDTSCIYTMDDLMDYINSHDEWEAKAGDVINDNGWVDETGEDYGICSDGKKRLYFRCDGDDLVADIKDVE